MSVCAFDSLFNGEYSNLFNVAAFSSKYFFGKISLPVKNSYLQTFPDDEAKIFAVCPYKSVELCFDRFCY